MAGWYRDLVAWKKGMELAKIVYKATAAFPKEERFGLTSQMRRAGVSIPSNIAEGQARFSKREFQHFLRNAKGSLAELETQIILAADLEFLDRDIARDLLRLCDEIGRILAGLLASLTAS